MSTQIAEQAGEVVEEAVDGIVDVVEVFKTEPKLLIAAGIVGAIGGVVGGYFLATKLLEQKYADLAQEEIGQAKVFYANLNKVDEETGEPITPQDVLAATQAVKEYQGDDKDVEVEPAGTPADEAMDEEQIAKLEERMRDEEEGQVKTPYRDAFRGGPPRDTVNVFMDDTFDLEEEIKNRDEDKPYIITHDEYFENERDYENYSYTWYELDGVLTDEHDKPVEQTDEVVGDEHLLRFGSGSKDPNIVYIRNARMGIDMEVIRSKGSYLEEVLGIPKEDENSLKHSAQGAARRAFRHGDG